MKPTWNDHSCYILVKGGSNITNQKKKPTTKPKMLLLCFLGVMLKTTRLWVQQMHFSWLLTQAYILYKGYHACKIQHIPYSHTVLVGPFSTYRSGKALSHSFASYMQLFCGHPCTVRMCNVHFVALFFHLSHLAHPNSFTSASSPLPPSSHAHFSREKQKSPAQK